MAPLVSFLTLFLATAAVLPVATADLPATTSVLPATTEEGSAVSREDADSLKAEIDGLTKEAQQQLAAVRDQLFSADPAPDLKAAFEKAYQAALEDLSFHGRNSKSIAERGDPQRARDWIRNHVEAIKANFESNIHDIQTNFKSE